VQPAALPSASSTDAEETSPEEEETVVPAMATPPKDSASARSREQPAKSHGRWVEGKQSEIASEESRRLAEEVRSKAQEAQRLAAEEVARSPPPAAVAPPVVPEEAAGTATEEAMETKRAFLPAAVFVGRKAGYAFKRGESGLGYYLDPFQSIKPPLPAPSSGSPSPSMPSPTSPSTLSAPSEAAPAPSPQGSSSFPFEFRQTKEAVAVILQVPGIIESTVDLRFGKNSFDIYFKAVPSPASASAPGGASSASGRLAEYAQGFDLFDEVQAEKCKYDVATQNLVVLLQKARPEYWMDRAPAGAGRREVLAARAYRPPSSGEGLGEGVGAGGRKPEGGNIPPIPSPSELLEAMKFSTQGLLDLD
jgi:HSP20 family molecular chaperone IbpA